MLTKTKRLTKPRREIRPGECIVQTINPECPACQADDAKELRFNEQEIAGAAPNGLERSHIVWRRRKCLTPGCQQVFVTIEHQMRN
jgi:hypothetical protein